ncbi:hypothetical protein PR048_026481 [Dryococelus australis]|uniref:Uncharacterized protein n=1 Tax=Dryococelus australis TaxID=614101 RepID=A0ABQ9GLG0_9NEOP|nr:hypothetical protein PR048_026481 [Dryococelus australis]
MEFRVCLYTRFKDAPTRREDYQSIIAGKCTSCREGFGDDTKIELNNSSVQKLVNLDFKGIKNQCNITDVGLGYVARKEVKALITSNVSQSDIWVGLLQKSPITYSTVRGLSCLDPWEMATWKDKQKCINKMKTVMNYLVESRQICESDVEVRAQYSTFLCEEKSYIIERLSCDFVGDIRGIKELHNLRISKMLRICTANAGHSLTKQIENDIASLIWLADELAKKAEDLGEMTFIVAVEDVAEYGSVLVPGSKKQNLNHLLNFHYAPREGVVPGSGHWRHGVPGYCRQAQGRWFATYKHKYNKEQFLQANEVALTDLSPRGYRVSRRKPFTRNSIHLGTVAAHVICCINCQASKWPGEVKWQDTSGLVVYPDPGFMPKNYKSGTRICLELNLKLLEEEINHNSTPDPQDCQFVVKADGNYTSYSSNPDALVDWDLIEQIKHLSGGYPYYMCEIGAQPVYSTVRIDCLQGTKLGSASTTFHLGRITLSGIPAQLMLGSCGCAA